MKHNWEYKRLGDVCEILNGYAFKSKLYIPNNGLRIIRIANVQDGYISDEAPQYYPLSYKNEINKYILQGGDLLMSLTGNVGRVGFLPQEMLPAALNQRVACLRFGSDIFKKFIFYRFRNKYFVSDCLNASKGIAQLNLSTEWLKEYIIPVPPKEELQQIVAELDKINELIAQNRELLRNLDSLAQSLFYDTFGDPVTNPKGWEESKLIECIVNGGSISYGIVQPGDDYPNGVPVVRPIDLNGGKYVTRDYLKIIDPAISDSYKRTILLGNEILMCVRGTTGIIRMADISLKDANVTRGITPLHIKGSINVTYMYEYLKKEKAQGFIKNYTKGTTLKQINMADLRNLPVLLPPLALQEQFAAKIEAIEAQKATIEKSIAELQTLLDSRMEYWFN